MKLVKRLFALLSASCVLISCLAVPVYATGELTTYEQGWLVPSTSGGEIALPGGGTALVQEGVSGLMALKMADWLDNAVISAKNTGQELAYLVRSFADPANSCAHSPNGRHSYVPAHTTINNVTSNFYVCEYCGRSGGEIFDTAYTDYTETLPYQSIDSTGGIIWQPTISDLKDGGMLAYGSGNSTEFNFKISTLPLEDYGDIHAYVSVNDDCSLRFSIFPGRTGNFTPRIRILWLITPIMGSYIRLSSPGIRGVGPISGNEYDYDWTSSESASSYTAGQEFSVQLWGNSYSCESFDVVFYLPRYRIIPYSGALDVSSSGDTYNTSTRAASIVGDYGILGENNTLSKVENTSIVNETDNSVYNPVTKETHTMSDWSYDYNNRSYNITYQTTDESTGNTTNNKMTVTYGDENVTINEGDQTYTVYYLVETTNNNGGNGGDGGDNHQHTYTSTVTREPTCTDFGIVTYTCTAGDSEYTATTAPLGHLWGLKQEVLNTYDENGELVTAGYKIYKCSRCGEEVRVDDGSGPPSTPNDSSGSSDGGDGDLTIDDPSDDLETFGGKLKLWFLAIPEMFGDLTVFLRVGWSYLPEEVLWLIEFGICMAVFLGIFNWLLRR